MPSAASCSSGRCPIDSSVRPGKILFITPPYHCGIAEIAGRWIPLNFISLAGSARLAGVLAEIYDAMARDHGHAEIRERLRDARAEYVATSAFTAAVPEALAVATLAKEIRPATVTILGGIHPTFCPEELLQSPAVDYLVMGEGEETLRHLLAVLEDGGDPASVPGIVFRRGEEIVRTPRRALMESIDDLPMAWDLLEWSEYSYFILPGSRLGAIATSRGCDRSCGFCSQPLFWEKSWRGRDPEKVVAELAHLHETYGVNVVHLVDEHATHDRTRWESFLELLLARSLPVSLIMETRAADIVRDRDLMANYRRAGIIHISLGVESTDPARLAFLGKEQTVDEVREALRLLGEAGIVSEASFLVGFPDETRESVGETLRQAQALNPDIANFMAYTPWPYCEAQGASGPQPGSVDHARYNLVDPVLEPAGMTLAQVEGAINTCFRKFNMGKMIDLMTMKDEFRRTYLLRATKLMMASPFIMKKLGVGLLGGIPARAAEVARKFRGEG